jgi:hypothetical protein
MIKRLVKRLRPRREANQGTHWHYLREAFATWRRVSVAKDTARMSADHEKAVRLCVLSEIAWRRYVRRLQTCIPK